MEKVIYENFEKITFPSCLKIKENFEDSYLVLEGKFLAEHKNEIINLIEFIEKIEKDKSPFERVLEMNDKGNRIEIKTAYKHLLRIIGKVIQKAYEGELNFNYPNGEKFIKANWKREI